MTAAAPNPYAAITTLRAINPGHVFSDEQARAELRRCAGTQFDPAVVEAFCAAR
jgi:response regulator RpfG family c-di-GMP phosphodiesterase